jgi:hypothetical protein
MGGRAFLCQISEDDWYISRVLGVYGNREGSERKGKVRYFGESSPTVQSTIEDLVGMRKGDLVFFHVLRKDEESSIHGVYRVREEPFFNEQRLWKSEYFIYPYRFCFEPHPEHVNLCRYDASIAVSQFYASVEIGEIRSIVTLEREERGAAHAVKGVAREDAEKIIEALYREFPTRRLQQPVKFEPLKISGPHLRNHIKRIGEIEFALKAVVAYKLGQEDPNFTQFIPACRDRQYDFLIQTFIGQTIRRPVDLVCIGYGNSERALTIIEVKRDIAKIDDLVQLLNYQEIFRIRGDEVSNLNFSACLLAKRFQPELVNYCHLRNLFIPWEEIVLLSYTPISNGTDAKFTIQTLQHLGEKAPDFSRGDESPKSLFESRVHK